LGDLQLASQEMLRLVCKMKVRYFQSLYYPTNAHNVNNVELLKRIKVMEAAPTCFGLQRSHHQGATASD
jgi:hypothetical protein